jgi:hypothetical protein
MIMKVIVYCKDSQINYLANINVGLFTANENIIFIMFSETVYG